MKRLAIFCVLAVAVCGALQAAGQHSNRRAPGFSLMDTGFNQRDMQDYLGKVVIVDFMQTTCPVCNTVADSLAELKNRYGDKIAILSVVTQPDSFDTANQFSARHHASWPIVFDSGQVMMSYLQMKPTGDMGVHFPHLFVVDRIGVIRNDFDSTDPDMMTVGALSREIDRLLK